MEQMKESSRPGRPARRLAVAVAAAALLSGCANASERAWGAPYTDITATSTETYARALPYSVQEQQRANGRLTLVINVKDTGNAQAIAEQAVNDLKADAQQVDLTVYGPQGRPPDVPYARAQWTSGAGVQLTRTPSPGMPMPAPESAR